MTFSEKLIRLRKREGISQEELALYLEVSRQAVSRWGAGHGPAGRRKAVKAAAAVRRQCGLAVGGRAGLGNAG